jgi:hypothetical protein
MFGLGSIDRLRKVVLARRIPMRLILRKFLIGTMLLCLTGISNAQKRIEGQLQIGDPNVMRDLDGFQIKAFGYLDASHRGTSQVKETLSGDRGQFSIEVMEQGSIVAAFAPDGSVVGWISAGPEQASLQIDVVRSSIISGQIMDSDQKSPVAGLRVRMVTPVGDGGLLRTSLGRSVTTDAEGRFTLNGILPGIPYWIQIGRQILDEESPAGADFENWLPFQVDQAEDWLLPTTWVRLNEQLDVKLASDSGASDTPEHPKSVPSAEAALEKMLTGGESSENRLMVYCRGGDRSSSQSLNTVLAGLQMLLGERFGLVILDPDQGVTQELVRKIRGSRLDQTWLAVLDSRGQVVSRFDTDFQVPPELFPKLQSRYWRSNPPKANQFLEAVGELVADLTLEEALQVVRLLGYTSLPGLAKFQ